MENNNKGSYKNVPTKYFTEENHATSSKPHRKESCCKRRTTMENFLIVLLLLFCIVFALIIVGIKLLGNEAQEEYCTTEQCVRAAARMLDAMDPAIDPCDDFFEYACGTWNKVNIIPDDKPNYNTFRKLNDDNTAILKVLLEKPIESKDSRSTQLIKKLYSSCIDTESIEARGASPLLELLANLGGWPVIEPQWSENNFDLERLLSESRLIGNRVMVSLWVAIDDRNSQQYVILIDQPKLTLPNRDYFLKPRDDDLLKILENFGVSVSQALGAPEATARADFRDVVDFEVEIAKIMEAEEARRDTTVLYKKLQVKDLYSNVTDAIDWMRYMTYLFKGVNKSITLEEPVVVYGQIYLTKLGNLLKRTSKRIVANYVIWYAAMNLIEDLHKEFRDIQRPFNKGVLGIDQDVSRWRQCVSFVTETLSMAIGRLFVQRYFDETAKADAVDMIENIKKAFIELLDDVDWMDDPTRTVAVEKANAIEARIGYPDYIMNSTALDQEYDGVQIDPKKFFENVLESLRTSMTKNLEKLHLPVDRSKWGVGPATVNAFYSATMNQITFPAAILQPPFYHPLYPKFIKYSGFGISAAHEITHGFDDEGRLYNKDGNLKEWWSDEVITKFKEKTECIIEQYNNYTLPEIGLNLNGVQLQGENIADNGGLKQAYKAYKKWAKSTGVVEPILPGVNLTREQLFFLNFAQIWCGTYRPESLLQLVRGGRHSPGKFRVIGPLSNMKDFADAFSCPLGSKMNPTVKCSVW